MSIITTLVGQWLGSKSPQELAQYAQADASLVEQLRPYQGIVVAYKKIAKVDMSADTLLDWMLKNYPEHGKVCFQNREWYNRQIEGLLQFVTTC